MNGNYQSAKNQPKSHFLFYKNVPLCNFYIMTLCDSVGLRLFRDELEPAGSLSPPMVNDEARGRDHHYDRDTNIFFMNCTLGFTEDILR